MNKRFEKGRNISQDGCQHIYKCFDRHTNGDFVMKLIPYESKDQGVPCSVLREISVLKELDHDNIARLLDVWDDADGFNLVFENTDLELPRFIYGSLKGELGLHVIQILLFQILEGVSYCHSKKVLHRDLKPQNLLINFDTRTVKLAHFGFSRTVDVPLPHYTITDENMLSYKAPEVLLHMPYSAPADMWSVGCIFAEMVNKDVLFKGLTEKHILGRISRALGLPAEKDWTNLISSVVPPETQLQQFSLIFPNFDRRGIDLLSKMLFVNPKQRITAGAALKHPYFKDLKADPRHFPF